MHDESSLSRLELVVLARLSSAKPPSERAVTEAILELGSPGESPARAREVTLAALGKLRELGLVNDGPRTLTEAGRKALRAAFELAHAPSWHEVRDVHLPALALGLRPGSPEARAVRKTETMTIAVLGAHFGLTKAATLNAICDALMAEALGMTSGPVTLSRLRAHVLALRLGMEAKGELRQLAPRFAATTLGARRSEKRAMAQALARRWVHGLDAAGGQASSEPPPASPPSGRSGGGPAGGSSAGSAASPGEPEPGRGEGGPPGEGGPANGALSRVELGLGSIRPAAGSAPSFSTMANSTMAKSAPPIRPASVTSPDPASLGAAPATSLPKVAAPESAGTARLPPATDSPGAAQVPRPTGAGSTPSGRTIHGTLAPFTARPSALSGEPTVSPATLLAVVREAIPRIGAAGRCGADKVFVLAIWRAIAGDRRVRDLTLDRFKQWLLVAHRDRQLDLASAELAGAIDPALVAASEIRDLGATFHVVLEQRVTRAEPVRRWHAH